MVDQELDEEGNLGHYYSVECVICFGMLVAVALAKSMSF